MKSRPDVRRRSVYVQGQVSRWIRVAQPHGPAKGRLGLRKAGLHLRGPGQPL
jgi:hypothetical protein